MSLSKFNSTDSIYMRNGYRDRRQYLEMLAEDYGLEQIVVFQLAALLGPNEDFDGLVTTLEDMEGDMSS